LAPNYRTLTHLLFTPEPRQAGKGDALAPLDIGENYTNKQHERVMSRGNNNTKLQQLKQGEPSTYNRLYVQMTRATMQLYLIYTYRISGGFARIKYKILENIITYIST